LLWIMRMKDAEESVSVCNVPTWEIEW
jgi:hypothetical protein